MDKDKVFINGKLAGFCDRVVNSKSYDYSIPFTVEYSYKIEGFTPVTEEEDAE